MNRALVTVVALLAGSVLLSWSRSDGPPAAGDGVAASRPASQPASAPSVRRVHVFVSGRVQGVGFRAYTEDAAGRLKLTGFVRNLRDGRVEAIAEGPSDQVDKLLAAVRRGPGGSRVDKVDLTEEKPTGEFTSFRRERDG